MRPGCLRPSAVEGLVRFNGGNQENTGLEAELIPTVLHTIPPVNYTCAKVPCIISSLFVTLTLSRLTLFVTLTLSRLTLPTLNSGGINPRVLSALTALVIFVIEHSRP